MLSKTSKYGIRALVYLAYLHISKQSNISVSEIANGTQIPLPYTKKILSTLAKHHFVGSIKGPGGGFYITEKSKTSTLLEIQEVFDGEGSCCECYMGLPNCSDKNPCPIHYKYMPVVAKMKAFMSTTKIQDITKEIDNEKIKYRFSEIGI